jgi:uncharacterized protein
VQGFTASVAEILGRPGTQKEIVLEATLEDLQGPLARISEDPLVGTLKAEAVVEGVLVTGRVEATLQLECARCLKAFETPAEADVCELFVADGQEAPAEDSYRIAGLEVDLEPMLRDALGVELPLNPLCKRDCKGLCSHCGADLNVGQCDCTEVESDPRWAALDEIRAKLEGQGA